MTESHETVAPTESVVDKRRAEVEAERQELEQLLAENTQEQATAEERVQLAQLDRESERIKTELAFQRRLKAARETAAEVPATATVVETQTAGIGQAEAQSSGQPTPAVSVEPSAPVNPPEAPATPAPTTRVKASTADTSTSKE